MEDASIAIPGRSIPVLVPAGHTIAVCTCGCGTYETHPDATEARRELDVRLPHETLPGQVPIVVPMPDPNGTG